MSQATQSQLDQANAKRVELEKQIEALKAEQAVLRSEKRKEFNLKVSEKGAISVYGFGRFPVTLYPDQMARLLSHAQDITEFMAVNKPSTDAIAAARAKVSSIK